MATEQNNAIRRLIGPEDLSDGDAEAMRLLLNGFSAIDWHRLNFRNHDEVYRFLRVNEFDPQSEDDMNRLKQLRREAVHYLTETLNSNSYGDRRDRPHPGSISDRLQRQYPATMGLCRAQGHAYRPPFGGSRARSSPSHFR